MTLDELRAQHRENILRITAQYGLTNVRVFGSVARGDATAKSDLDLLVTMTRPLGFEFFDCKHDLEDMIHVPVDLLTDDALDKYIGPYILREASAL